MPSFAAQRSLFRAYDIRGARQHFTSSFVHALAQAFCVLYQTADASDLDDASSLRPNQKTTSSKQMPRVVIGYDTRCGSQAIAETLAHVLSASVQVICLGLVTTPMMALWAARYDGHGIMVTASHSHKDILGIKWMHAYQSPSRDDILSFRDTVLSLGSADTSAYDRNTARINTDNEHSTCMSLSADCVARCYADAISDVFVTLSNSQYPNVPKTGGALQPLNMTVVVDCMHGASGRIAALLFRRFCKRVILLNDAPDGQFPLGNPDPAEPNRLAELQHEVILNRADIGLAFDGDADRLMIVDNSGKLVAPDHLLYLLAHIAIIDRPSRLRDAVYTHNQSTPKVLFDVKCAHHLAPLITAIGAEAVMSKTGSSLMRHQLQNEPDTAIFAGELSGHFIFNDGYFLVYDDAIYASLRLLFWLAYAPACDPIANMPRPTLDVWGAPRIKHQRQLTDITQHLPRLVSTADHYLPLPTMSQDSCSIIEHITRLCCYLQAQIDTLSCRCLSPSTDTCDCMHQAQSNLHNDAAELIPVGTRISCIDGVRLDFAHGFGVLRQSNTSHSLTVRFAGDSEDDLRAIQARFVRLCQPFDSHLAEQIATIEAA